MFESLIRNICPGHPKKPPVIIIHNTVAIPVPFRFINIVIAIRIMKHIHRIIKTSYGIIRIVVIKNAIPIQVFISLIPITINIPIEVLVIDAISIKIGIPLSRLPITVSIYVFKGFCSPVNIKDTITVCIFIQSLYNVRFQHGRVLGDTQSVVGAV